MNKDLIIKNINEALELINSPEYDEADFNYLEALLITTLNEVNN